MENLVGNKKDELRELCIRCKVSEFYIFGSALTNRFNEQSDVDFLVAFQPQTLEEYTDNYFELHESLEVLLGRKVDLITMNSLSNPFFVEELEKTRELIYAA
jgi:predicted nucleotidyltransferase